MFEFKIVLKWQLLTKLKRLFANGKCILYGN